jgi:hypothetical protein
MIGSDIQLNANFLPFSALSVHFNNYCTCPNAHLFPYLDSILPKKDALQNKKIYSSIQRGCFSFIAKELELFEF